MSGDALTTLRYLAGAPLRRLALPHTHRGYARFVIVAAPRTGSTLLVERCNSHPAIECFGEMLQPEEVQWARIDGPRTGWIKRRRRRSVTRFLETCVWHRFPRATRAVGVKLLYHQFLPHRAALAPYLRAQPELRVILLRRDNLLANLASARVATMTARYTIHDPRDRPDLPRLHLSPARCEDWFRRFTLMQRMVAGLFAGHPRLHLDYETLVRDPAAQDRRLCAFLGVEQRPLVQRSVKMDPLPLSERIANFDELREHFAGTRWARFFAGPACGGARP